MRRRTKFWLGFLAAVILVVVSAAILAPTLVDADRFRGKLEQAASRRLGRQVELDRLSFRLLPLPSLRADGLRVAALPEEGADHVLRADDVRVGVELLGLLRGDLRLSSVVVQQPRILVYRRPSGEWALEDVLPGSSEAREAEGQSVRVDRIAVAGATILLRDAHLGTAERPLEARFEQVHIALGGLGGDPPYRLEASLVAPGGGKLSWEGSAGPGGEGGWPVGKGDLVLGDLDLGPVAPWVDEMTGIDLRGRLDADLRLAHPPGGTVAADGSLSAEGLSLEGRMREPLDLALEIDGSSLEDGTKGEIAELSLRAGELEVAGSASWQRVEGVVRGTLHLEPSRIRPESVRELARAMGRPATWRGVGEDPFQVQGEAAFELEDGALRSLDLRRLVLEGISVELERTADQELLLPGLEMAGGSAGGGDGEIVLRLGEIVLRDARARWVDRAVSPTATWSLQDVALQLGGWGGESPASLRLQARLAEGGGALRAEGTVGPRRAGSFPLDLEAEIEALSLVRVNPYLGEGRKGPFTAGTGTLRLEEAAGDLEESVRLRGALSLSGARVLAEGRANPVALPLRGSFRAGWDAQREVLDLESMSLRLEETSLQAAGSVALREEGTAVEARLTEPAQVDPADLEALLAALGTELPFTLRSERPVEVRGSFRRSPKGDLEVEGGLEIRRATLTTDRVAAPIEVDSASVRGTGTSADLRVAGGKIGGSDFSGTFDVQGFDRPQVGFDLQSNRADLSELLSFLDSDASSSTGGSSRGAGPAGSGGDIVARTRARGRLRVAQGSFKTLDFQNLDTTLTMEGYELRFDPFDLSLYGGKAQASARTDLASGPDWNVSGRIDGVAAQEILRDNTGWDGLTGTATATFDLEGRALGLERVVREASGNGSLTVRDGHIAKLDLFQTLSELSGLFGERSLSRLSRRLGREGTDFSELAAPWTLEGGRLRTEDLRLETPDATVNGSGAVILPQQTLDLATRVAFSEALSGDMRQEGSAAAELFWNDRRNRVVLPVGLRGPIARPKPVLDGGSLVEQLARKEAREKIEKKVGGDLGGVLGEILGGGKDREPDGAGGEAGDGAAPATSSAPGVRVTSHRMAGNFLRPDLRIEGRFSGRGLQRADLEVRTTEGRLLYAQKDAFPEIGAWYAGHSREGPAEIPFSKKVDADHLGAAGELRVTITLYGEGDRKAEASFTETRSSRKLF